MAHNVIEIANRIVLLARPEVGDHISNLKVQKLLYYVQGFHLAIHDKPIFNENILAWQYGPVVREAYQYLKGYGSGHIEIDDANYEKYYVEFPPSETELICDVWNVYGQYSAYRLMEFTHNEPPWYNTPMNEIITHDRLKRFFFIQINEIR
jgi:uncharacterized phage-associated protein